MNLKPIVIAVDGYSSCGKSTFAKLIANKLGYTYIDSGAMYRAITFAYLKAGGAPTVPVDESLIGRVLNESSVSFIPNDQGDGWITTLNGEAIEDQVRSIQVSGMVSQISALAQVRKAMVTQQQLMGRNKGIVMDGRDIGTVVFPQAELKIFMTADPRIRAQRRFNELSQKGHGVTLDEIVRNIEERDRIDQARSESPLRQAPDAIVLDNSYMTIEQQLEWVDEILEDIQGTNTYS